MKKKISQLVVSFMLVLSLFIPYSVQAFIGEDLDLTDEQKAELREIGEATFEAILPLFKEVTTLREELEEILVAGEEIDLEAADAINEKILRARSEIISIRASAKLQKAQVLTLEQREMMIYDRKERREMRKERREERKQTRKDRTEGIDFSF